MSARDGYSKPWSISASQNSSNSYTSSGGNPSQRSFWRWKNRGKVYGCSEAFERLTRERNLDVCERVLQSVFHNICCAAFSVYGSPRPRRKGSVFWRFWSRCCSWKQPRMEEEGMPNCCRGSYCSYCNIDDSRVAQSRSDKVGLHMMAIALFMDIVRTLIECRGVSMGINLTLCMLRPTHLRHRKSSNSRVKHVWRHPLYLLSQTLVPGATLPVGIGKDSALLLMSRVLVIWERSIKLYVCMCIQPRGLTMNRTVSWVFKAGLAPSLQGHQKAQFARVRSRMKRSTCGTQRVHWYPSINASYHFFKTLFAVEKLERKYVAEMTSKRKSEDIYSSLLWNISVAPIPASLFACYYGHTKYIHTYIVHPFPAVGRPTFAQRCR